MLHERENWLFQTPDNIRNGDFFFGGNYRQLKIDTDIFKGKKNLKFYRANLINVKLDPSWQIERCNTAKVVYYDHYDEDAPGGSYPRVDVKKSVGLGINKAKKLSRRNKNLIFQRCKNKVNQKVFRREIELPLKLKASSISKKRKRKNG